MRTKPLNHNSFHNSSETLKKSPTTRSFVTTAPSKHFVTRNSNRVHLSMYSSTKATTQNVYRKKWGEMYVLCRSLITWSSSILPDSSTPHDTAFSPACQSKHASFSFLKLRLDMRALSSLSLGITMTGDISAPKP